MWFIGVEVEQETSAPPPKKNPGSAPANIVHFSGLKVKIVKCDQSLSHTLFGTRQKCDIHRRFFKFTEWKKSALIILYLVLYSARSRSVTCIVHFWGLRSEIVNFGYSLCRTLFAT